MAQTTFPIAGHLHLRYFPAIISHSLLVIDGKKKIPNGNGNARYARM